MKPKLIVIDDLEISRVILKEAFSATYEVLEAENGLVGLEKIKENKKSLKAIFLDMVMPKMNGFEVLTALQGLDMLTKIPVFIITSASDKTLIDKAFNFGVADVIPKPFNITVIRQRVKNIIELFDTRNNLSEMVNMQIDVIDAQSKQLQRTSWDLIEELANVVEFRSNETGNHIHRVKKITGVIAQDISLRHPELGLSDAKIKALAQASVLHDIGKIAVPDAILEKPGKLTKEEFDIMKTHTSKGYEMLKSFTFVSEPIYTYCLQIARSHHEKWDGKGYPQGLKGNEIPLRAQIVSIADVYDALLSKRCYKPEFTKDKAIEMINNGECGIFNPILLESFNNVTKNTEDDIGGGYGLTNPQN